jgi:hypothetical protein
VGFSLTPGTVSSGTATVTATITTNAINGGMLQLKGTNTGLTSGSMAYTIPSATADLGAVSSGYGAQVTNVSQSSGGPMTANSPFNGSGNNVGQITNSYQSLSSFASAVTGGSTTLDLKAKTNTAAPAAYDYTDTVTLTLSVVF